MLLIPKKILWFFIEHWDSRKTVGSQLSYSFYIAFPTLFDQVQEFTTSELFDIVNKDRILAQFPLLYVNREGTRFPITFNTSSRVSAIARITESKVILVAFHISEVLEDLSTIESTNIPTSILAIYKTNSTLLLVELMDFVIEFMPRCCVVLWPVPKKMIF
jgi:hypothetical protein